MKNGSTRYEDEQWSWSFDVHFSNILWHTHKEELVVALQPQIEGGHQDFSFCCCS